MSDDSTSRLRLPLIQPGQAQKELYHNEALALLDLLVQPAVQELGRNTPPTAPALGNAWIVGPAPTGIWAGMANAVAGWTPGGWRFTVPTEGATYWVSDRGSFAVFSGGSWSAGALRGETLTLAGLTVVGARRGAIGDVTGGSVVDVEARTAIGAILGALRGHGLIAS